MKKIGVFDVYNHPTFKSLTSGLPATHVLFLLLGVKELT